MTATGRSPAQEWCRRAERLVVLCGAGLSVASGVPTFRGPAGLWRQYRPEELASPTAFARDPLLVWQWYAQRQQAIARCRPNAGHRALAQALAAGRRLAVLTQNVDGLQQRACAAAGVEADDQIEELHGCLWRLRCTACGARRMLSTALQIDTPEDLPRCASCGGLERPAVVWFGEGLDQRLFERAIAAARASTVFIIAGTSGVVEPAASLARLCTGHVIEINPEPTPLSAIAEVSIRGGCEQFLPELFG